MRLKWLSESTCWRKSGPQSIKILSPQSVSIHAEVRSRLSRESAEAHTWQLHPTCGMPVLVPVPKKRNFILSGLGFTKQVFKISLYCLVAYSSDTDSIKYF